MNVDNNIQIQLYAGILIERLQKEIEGKVEEKQSLDSGRGEARVMQHM